MRCHPILNPPGKGRVWRHIGVKRGDKERNDNVEMSGEYTMHTYVIINMHEDHITSPKECGQGGQPEMESGGTLWTDSFF